MLDAQVEHQMRRLARREGVAMHADARARGHLGADARIGERHGIIAGLRDLGRMAEARAIARCRAWPDRRAPAARSSPTTGMTRKSPRSRMARAREMGVAESPGSSGPHSDSPPRMVVACADLAGRVGVGAQLHHAERRDGAGKGMPLAARADHRIDRIIGARLRRARRGGGREGEGEQRGRRAKGHGHPWFKARAAPLVSPF